MKTYSFTFVFIGLLAAMLTFNAPIAAQSKSEQVRRLKAKATEAEKLKNHREAADAYAQILVLTPNDADAHYRKGFAHYTLKEWEPAANDFTLALNKGFKPPLRIYEVRHLVYFELKNYDAAMADVNKGLEIAPTGINFLTAAGQINLDRKSYPEALAAFQKAALAAPNNADLHYYMAQVHFAAGDSKAQAAAAEAALAKGTRFPGEAFNLLGDANQKLRNIPGAIDAYQKAVNVKPDLYQVYRNLAEIFRGENRFADAISILKRGQDAFPSDGNLYTDLSLLYGLADRSEDAVQAGLAGTSLLPQQPAAYTHLCRAYNDVGKYQSAVIACNAALRLKPGDGETLFYLGRAFNLLGKEAEATKFYSQAVSGLMKNTVKNPASSESWYLLGNAYFTVDQLDKAIEAYLRSLELSPKFANARYNLGIIYTRKKQKGSAVEQYDRLVSLDAGLAEKLRKEIDRM